MKDDDDVCVEQSVEADAPREDLPQRHFVRLKFLMT
jgi:hypothetical protein